MSTSQLNESQPTLTLTFDKVAVNKDISEKGEYSNDQSLIKNYVDPLAGNNKENQSQQFLANISAEDTVYKGILNSNFQRNNYGFNKFDNGDIYLGQFDNDNRTGKGIYIWEPRIDRGRVTTELYTGEWKNEIKNGKGIYFWMDEKRNSKKFDDTNFEAYVGKIKDDKFSYGTYLIKQEDNYYLYHGKIDENGRKNDDTAFLYSSKMDRLMYGKIDNDIFVSGYMAFFNSETGEMIDLNFIEFEQKDKIKQIVRKNKIEKNTLKKMETLLDDFRNAILDKDYFGILYNKFKDALSFSENGVKSIETFEKKDKMTRMVNLCDAYKVDNVFDDILGAI
ncbi:MAG: hypothetical protein MJ252_12945 [archaeon]|nr:hypothetical protein [archaeon]